MRFDIGTILAVIALILVLAHLAGMGGTALIAVAVLLLALAYLVPAWSGRGRWT